MACFLLKPISALNLAFRVIEYVGNILADGMRVDDSTGVRTERIKIPDGG